MRRFVRRVLFVLFLRRLGYDIVCGVVKKYVTDIDSLEGLYDHVRHLYIEG